MTGLGPVAWPPAPISTERLVLRVSEARDRAAFIELFASPEVRTYLGGPRPRDELERALPAVSTAPSSGSACGPLIGGRACHGGGVDLLDSAMMGHGGPVRVMGASWRI